MMGEAEEDRPVSSHCPQACLVKLLPTRPVLAKTSQYARGGSAHPIYHVLLEYAWEGGPPPHIPRAAEGIPAVLDTDLKVHIWKRWVGISHSVHEAERHQ